MINAFINSITPMFSRKSDYAALILSDSSYVALTTLYYKLQYSVDCLHLGASIIFTSVFCPVSTTTFNALVIALKFLVLIALLIFIRGGIPRYRFDHLTKIG